LHRAIVPSGASTGLFAVLCFLNKSAN
jgi:hypothetical protein